MVNPNTSPSLYIQVDIHRILWSAVISSDPSIGLELQEIKFSMFASMISRRSSVAYPEAQA